MAPESNNAKIREKDILDQPYIARIGSNNKYTIAKTLNILRMRATEIFLISTL